jgi:hypothetical protein
LKPWSPNCSIAASRIRAMAVRSSAAERMFSMLNARLVRGQGRRRQEFVKNRGLRRKSIQGC